MLEIFCLFFKGMLVQRHFHQIQYFFIDSLRFLVVFPVSTTSTN